MTFNFTHDIILNTKLFLVFTFINLAVISYSSLSSSSRLLCSEDQKMCYCMLRCVIWSAFILNIFIVFETIETIFYP